MRHLCLLLLFLSSCRSTSESHIRITNPLPADGKYPEVVRFLTLDVDGNPAICTGTFVDKRKLLTAAHCFYDAKGRPKAKIQYADENGLFHLGKMTAARDFVPLSPASKFDLGIVTFSADVAPAVTKIGSVIPKEGDKIVLVGFGASDAIAQTGMGKKRMGNNTVAKIDDNLSVIKGFATEYPVNASAGANSVTAVGDSGGALFNDSGELVGVIRGGKVFKTFDDDGNTIKKSAFVINIAHPESAEAISDITARACRGEFL